MMPVLRQPRYTLQPVPWDEKEPDPQDQPPSLPIYRIGEEAFADNKASETEVDIRSIRKEGYEAGYREGFLVGQQEGFRQGVAAAEQRFREEQWQQHQYIQQLLNRLTDTLREELATFFQRAEEAVTELALEIARKVVEVEVKTNPEIVRRAVAQALRELKGGVITVRLHPEDFLLLGENLSLLNLDESLSVRFVPDDSVERGGVIAESEQGLVDLQPHTKLALLHSEVL